MKRIVLLATVAALISVMLVAGAAGPAFANKPIYACVQPGVTTYYFATTKQANE